MYMYTFIGNCQTGHSICLVHTYINKDVSKMLSNNESVKVCLKMIYRVLTDRLQNHHQCIAAKNNKMYPTTTNT